MAKRSTTSEPKKPVNVASCDALLFRGVIGELELAHRQPPKTPRPIRAVMAFTRFHCFGSIRSISRMPSANTASIIIGRASR